VKITKGVAEPKISILSVSYQSPLLDVVTAPFHSCSPPHLQCGRSVVLHTLMQCLLTPWSRVLLEKLTGSQLVKKFPTFYGNRRFITTLTSARHLSLSWTISIRYMPTHRTFWRSILILSFHLRLSWEVGPSHQDMVRPQVADGGTASNM